ncbi:YchE family NAAT transporter [Buchnera aphidicola]|uniref:YchE family NAAT transporter n=1 Tax=Buchnera aphidicola TaxID=9 RepID=UPI00094D84B2|nr:YchE family NAAT transporter [Buchnera aphidicola]
MNFFNTELYVYIKFFISLFTIINPIGMIPVFISLTNNQTNNERNKTNMKANFTALIILLFSLFYGCYVLDVFNISIESFRIAGGLLIFTIAYSMINGTLLKNISCFTSKNNISNINKQKKLSAQDISIMPLAMPLIAGPGAISSVILWRMQYSNYYHLIGFSFVIVFFSFFCWVVFKISPYITTIIDEIYITVINRIMGLLLLALAVECIFNGMKSIFFSYI